WMPPGQEGSRFQYVSFDTPTLKTTCADNSRAFGLPSLLARRQPGLQLTDVQSDGRPSIRGGTIMRARRTLIGFLVLLAASNQHAQGVDGTVDWIRSHAVLLKTTEAGNGFDDLRPLRALIGQARIVSLGEATHGSREFFQMKHRMLEFLATELGFSIF